MPSGPELQINHSWDSQQEIDELIQNTQGTLNETKLLVQTNQILDFNEIENFT